MPALPFVRSERIIETISDIVNNANVARNFSGTTDSTIQYSNKLEGSKSQSIHDTPERHCRSEMLPPKSIIARVKSLFPQALAAFAVWIITLQIGVMCVWSSPYIAQLIKPDSPLPLTPSEASWVASLLNVGRLTGAILGAVCVNLFGSKKTCLITAIPSALGWILAYVANSPEWLYASRFSAGIGFGYGYSCFSLYLGEVADPKIRGSLVSFAMMGGPAGNFFASVLGSNTSLQTSSIIFFAPCVLLIVILSILPDSPHYLVKNGYSEEAKKSIEFYRGSHQVDKELEQVSMFVKSTTAVSFKERLAEFRLPHNKRATILVMMLFVFMQLSGLNNVLFYMETILLSGGVTIILPSTVVSYALASSVLTASLCIGLYDKCGRRLLLIASSLGVFVALSSLGTHFALKDAGIEWIGSQWLPVVSIFLFITFFNVGLASVAAVVSSEVYSTSIKPVAACLANLTAAVSAFTVSKAYQPLVDSLGEAYVFYGHAFVTILAVPYALAFMPETKGKSLQEIQEDLIKKK